MKWVHVWYVIALFFALSLAGCAGSTPGPNTWIDKPLDGDRVGMEKMTILAHAANTLGIDHVEFVANDVFLGSVSGGGVRFAEVSIEWLPPATGRYAIRAVAVDSKGNNGPQAVAHVIVEGLATAAPSAPPAPSVAITSTPAPLVQPTATPTPAPLVQPTATPTPTPLAQPTATPTPTPLAQPTATPTPVPPAQPTLSPTPKPTPTAPTPTPTPTPPIPADLRFWVDRDTVQAGECTTVRWHVSGVRAYWVDGNAGAGDDGDMEICPCDDETHTLHVVKADGSEHDLSVSVSTRGECAAPPPPPPGDDEGPSIEEAWLEPRGTSDTGCRVFAHAQVSDESGVGWVRFHWAIDGDGWNTIDMGHLGGNDYESPVPGTSGGSGTIEFRVEAGDVHGNTSQNGPNQQNLPFCGPG